MWEEPEARVVAERVFSTLLSEGLNFRWEESSVRLDFWDFRFLVAIVVVSSVKFEPVFGCRAFPVLFGWSLTRCRCCTGRRGILEDPFGLLTFDVLLEDTIDAAAFLSLAEMDFLDPECCEDGNEADCCCRRADELIACLKGGITDLRSTSSLSPA